MVTWTGVIQSKLWLEIAYRVCLSV